MPYRFTALSGLGAKGPACFLVETGGVRVMLDAGAGPDIGRIPDLSGVGKLDAVILSHAHPDHCGALHLLHGVGDPQIFATRTTLDALGVEGGSELPVQGTAIVAGIGITTGRAGHCAGGIWIRLDIGGGLGVPYRADNEWPPHPDEYARVVKDTLGDLGLRIVMEPGRMIVANAGVLITRVLYVKQGQGRRFTIVDAAMNDLIRPTLYEAHHDVWPVAEPQGVHDLYVQDLVGPVCETGDYLALDRPLPAFKPDDLVAVMTAGAYGAVMSSTYNSRLLVPEVMVKGDAHAIVRPRRSFDDLIGLDLIPPWIDDA